MNIAAKGNITKTVLLLIVIIFSFALPLAAPDAFSLVVFTVALVFIILSSSWNLVYGYAGQISLGHPAFLGIGGYTAAYLGGIISPWLAILAGGLAGALAGFVIGLPSLRLRGIYLGIATFAFPAILEQFTLSFEQYTGGQTGLSVIRLTPVAIPFIGTISFDSNISYYYLFLIMTLGSIFAIYLMVRSKIGLILTSIKDDENLTKAMGINTTKYKMIAFVTSAFFAGLAGSLYDLHWRDGYNYRANIGHDYR